jgi:hypothetical protein
VTPRKIIYALVLVGLGWWLRKRLKKKIKKHPATLFHDAVISKLQQHQMTFAHTGIEEISNELNQRQLPSAPIVSRATRRYLENRFSNIPMNQEESAALLKSLDDALQTKSMPQ